MPQHTVAPFYQLGRRISLMFHIGVSTETVSGEVMDTDTGWIAIKVDTEEVVRWYNLDNVLSIQVMNHTGGE